MYLFVKLASKTGRLEVAMLNQTLALPMELPMAPFSVDGLEVLLDECDINIVCSVYNFISGKRVSFRIRRTKLSKNALKHEIVRNGGKSTFKWKELCMAIEEYVNDLLSLCSYSRVCTTAHKKVGFIERDGGVEFDSSIRILSDSSEVYSRYYGRLLLDKKGDVSAIKDLYEKLIESGSMALPLSLVGATATVLAFSNRMWGTHIYNFIVHIADTSSTGKSSIARLVASFGGCPETSSGFFLSYLGTADAIVKMMTGVNGMPFVLDEFSAAEGKKDWSDFVYILANGYDKERCIAGGAGVAEVGAFETVFLSTGERFISSKCSKNDGIKARLFEIGLEIPYASDVEDAKFTNSAEESDFINRTAEENYGFLSIMIAKELMCNSEKYNSIRNKWLATCKAKFKEEALVLNIAERVMNYVALIMTAAEVMQSVLEVEFDLEKIFAFYFFHFIEKHSEDTNVDGKVYDLMKQMIALNSNRLYPAMQVVSVPSLDEIHVGYEVDLSHHSNRDRHKGADGEYYDYLYIFPVEFVDDYLKERGFTDSKQAINTLRKRKLIKSSRSGSNPKFDLQLDIGIVIPTYAIWIKKGDDNPNYFQELFG